MGSRVKTNQMKLEDLLNAYTIRGQVAKPQRGKNRQVFTTLRSEEAETEKEAHAIADDMESSGLYDRVTIV